MKSFALKELTLSITDGKHGDCKNEENSGYYFISCKDIKDGNILYEDARQITKEDFIETHKRTKLECDDILVTNSGTIGRMAFVTDAIKANRTTFQKSVAIIKPNKNIIVPLYLYYAIKSNMDNLAGNANGSAQKNLLLSTMRDFNLTIHSSLSVQRKIASILSAYDDLIENNKKQIKLLEEAAQRLYKEWFVDLRFPGHENVPVVVGVREGWERKRIKEVVATTSGGTPSRGHAEYYRDGSFFWIKTKELDDGFIFETEELISEEAVNKSSAKILKTGSIILAMYGATIGKLGITTTEMTCNQACCVFDMSTFKNGTEFLFCWLLEHRNFLIHQGKGAAQPNLSQEMIKNFEIILPDIQILEKFSSITSELFALKSSFQKKILLLKSKRDAILPKLTSGEIEV